MDFILYTKPGQSDKLTLYIERILTREMNITFLIFL